MIPKAVRVAVIARAGSRCERCGTWCDTAAGYYSLQHRVARGMGGTKTVDNASRLALLCGSATTLCHGEVESRPLEALEDGWRVRQGDNPATVPIRHHELGLVLLTDNYEYGAAA